MLDTGGPPITVPLRVLGRGDLAIAGGKGANLGELMRAGLPVPRGFVVTTAAYDGFIARSQLPVTIFRGSALHGGGAALRLALEQSIIPHEVARPILAAYRELGQGPVAVRSSATAEDLPEAAFAGQQDSFLNVEGDDALLDAVRRCWASLWTDRAIAYRARQGIDQATVKLAVVVQRMVPAEVAGVMFTANPVTGARDEVVVDASPGLGESVVSGLVTPDHYVLDKRVGRVKERRLGRREVVVRARQGGGTERVEGVATPGVPTLPDRVVREIAGLGAAIETHFGWPQDVEWAWAGGEVFIVQSRPITALPEPPPRPTLPQRMIYAVFAEMFPIRPYPLDMTAWVPGISRGAVEPLFNLVGIQGPSVQTLFLEEDGVAVRFSGKVAVRPTPGMLLTPARLAWLALRYDPNLDRADPSLVEARAQVRALEAMDLESLSWGRLLAAVGEELDLIYPLAGEVRYRYFPRTILAALLLRFVLELMGRGHSFGTLLSGVESSTVVANRALESLAGGVRSDPVLAGLFERHEPGELWAVLEREPAGRSFLAELQAFLDRYGHREMVLATALKPTWRDAPELALGIVKGLALVEPRRTTGRPAWEEARDGLLAHPVFSFAPLRAALLATLSASRGFLRIREDSHYDATLILPVLRRTLLEFGTRLVGAGVLDIPEDVFHLRLEDLEEVGPDWPPSPQLAGELAARVARRKERRAELGDTPLFDPRLYQNAEPEDSEIGVGTVLLRGMPGSPGVAEGAVRVIRDSSAFGNLLEGEVLVAPYTNPAWTPLFQRAAAVVVDAGGPVSHAAIVAREYGVPAVMATVSGTARLQDGQRVRVDGTRGLVMGIDRLGEGAVDKDTPD